MDAVPKIIQIAPGLPVAHAAHRGHGGLQIAPRPQRCHFVEKACGQHCLEARSDAGMQHRAVRGLKRNREQRKRRLGIRARHADQFAHRPPAQGMDLEGALDALRIAGLKARGGLRIDRRQSCMHRRPAELRRFLIERSTHGRVGARQVIEADGEGARIEHRAAHQQRQSPAAADLADQLAGIVHEAGGRIRLGGLDQIDQVMRHRSQLGDAWLGGADVHAAIDQRRVDADDLEIEALGETHGDRALARGGRAEQHDRVGWGRVRGSERQAQVCRAARIAVVRQFLRCHQAHRPRKNQRSSSVIGTCTQVGRPWLHWSAPGVDSMSRSRAFICSRLSR